MSAAHGGRAARVNQLLKARHGVPKAFDLPTLSTHLAVALRRTCNGLRSNGRDLLRLSLAIWLSAVHMTCGKWWVLR